MTEIAARGSHIVGLGHYQPERVLTNDELSTLVDTSDEWITTRTGIKTRHIATADETVASMATEAARNALADAGLEPTDISMVIVASTSSTHRSPNAAARVATTLGVGGPAILDINTACSGFEYGVALADQAIRAGAAERVLVVGSEKLSAITDWTDRTTCVLTADGAGAAILEATSGEAKPEVGPVLWGSVPEMLDAIRVDGDPEIFSQEGRTIYRWAITEAAGIARRIVETSGIALADIDVFAFHQANLRIIEPLAEALGATGKIVIRDIVESGNTSAASVPLGLSKAWHRGELPPGSQALLFGFGGGFTYAGQVVRLPRHTPVPQAG
ncbi:MAG: 3-oxoacyl-ACP synthase [Frondihabitans sp.]|nr:3-oxoacyl-ACP synthase [Frondihabitans sp.]